MWLIASFLTASIGFDKAQGLQAITIYPQYHSQNGRFTFEPSRWNGHHGLDTTNTTAYCRLVGTRAGRWPHPDITNDLFLNVPEDPNRKGYSDPEYFKDPQIQEQVFKRFKQNVDAYGRNIGVMMYTLGIFWPMYMGWAKYAGLLPDNLEAGVELIYQMMEGIEVYTGGIVPTYYEAVNEPAYLKRFLDSRELAEFCRLVAQRLKGRWHNMLVGGPSYTGEIGVLHENHFKVWKILQGFMNLSIDFLDFFSFIGFNHYEVEKNSSHKWGILDEAKLIGIIDMVENYAHIKSGKMVPVIPTEWGLADPEVWVKHQSGLKSEWTFGYDHNSQLFTYLSNRGFVERGDAYLASHFSEKRYQHASVFYPNNTETGVARAYRFWQPFNSNHKFLRVDSAYDNAARMVTPLALVDPLRKELFILLNNYAQNISTVQLIFPNFWMGTTYETSICYQLDDTAGAVLNTESVNITGGQVHVPAESSCSLKFTTTYDLSGIKIISETVFFGDRMVIPIQNLVANVTMSVNDTSKMVYCRLRLTVTVNNSTSIITPTAVYFNGLTLPNYYSRMKPSGIQRNVDFDVLEYAVYLSMVDLYVNAVSAHFHHSNGYLVSAALIIGRRNSNKGF